MRFLARHYVLAAALPRYGYPPPLQALEVLISGFLPRGRRR